MHCPTALVPILPGMLPHSGNAGVSEEGHLQFEYRRIVGRIAIRRMLTLACGKPGLQAVDHADGAMHCALRPWYTPLEKLPAEVK